MLIGSHMHVGVGPGCSSVGVGAFSENGPFRPSGNALTRNEYSWNKGERFFLHVAVAIPNGVRVLLQWLVQKKRRRRRRRIRTGN
jgi:hypothetical protein